MLLSSTKYYYLLQFEILRTDRQILTINKKRSQNISYQLSMQINFYFDRNRKKIIHNVKLIVCIYYRYINILYSKYMQYMT